MRKTIKSINSSNFLYKGIVYPSATFKGGFKSVCVSMFLSLTVISCSTQNNLSTASISSTEKVSIFKVSDNQGAEINLKISTDSSPFEGGNGISSQFSTKANTNGTVGRIVSDVDHYVVYLIKDSGTGTYPLNGDPLNASNIVSGPFTVSKTNTAIKFTGVNPLAIGAYYVAVRAQNISNVDIIQTNNNSGTAWTGTTAATYNGKVAVSSGAGITVNSAYQVNTPTALGVTVNLANGTGSGITAQTNFNQTNTQPKSNILGYISTTVAGTGDYGYSGDGGPATDAEMSDAIDVVLDSLGNLYIADGPNSALRKVTASTGIISTIPNSGFYSRGLAIDSANNIYIATGNVVKKMNTSGVFTNIVGTGVSGNSGDGGQATAAKIDTALDVDLDASGNLYIADFGNNNIRKVSTSGVITTIAGGGASLGDGGQATSAKLNLPTGVAVDRSGNVYIADRNNNRIRKVNALDNKISTIAGTGIAGTTGDGGPAISAQINNPQNIETDSSGNIYFTQSSNRQLRKIDAVTGIISTIGNGSLGHIDSSGNIYAILGREVVKLY